ncbi:hypothetical protein POM88_041419 [Heracleum sosnowskyi]|uniref:Uncharacterized protein n=1 Tax=Heracleum sosnowskyi TaxID=360622 RepID=A0AAD8HFV2_9APIA|nr:hypothetical protein POM88_041419 [Heracleum sosnowskyi]
MLELVEVGILEEEDIEHATSATFNPNRCGFEGKGEIWVENILNLGVSPSKLIEIMKTRFNSCDGVILEGLGVSSICVYDDAAGWFQDLKLKYRKKYYQRLTNMLPGLGNAKTLTFDLESIEALNKISDLLVSLPSPFYNLKFVKLPWGFKESSISSALRNYLLGGSPKAAIGTKFPENTMDYQEVPCCLTSQKFMLDEALATNVNDPASRKPGGRN